MRKREPKAHVGMWTLDMWSLDCGPCPIKLSVLCNNFMEAVFGVPKCYCVSPGGVASHSMRSAALWAGCWLPSGLLFVVIEVWSEEFLAIDF